MRIPGEIQDLCQALRIGLRAVLGKKLYAVYLYGALAFPGAGPLTDLDFHAILRAAPEGGEAGALDRLHRSLVRVHPLGAELDGYYILLEAARQAVPPPHLLVPGVRDESWALHRAHWHAGRCVVLHGPHPRQVVPMPAWAGLEAALLAELEYVEQHLHEHPAYCALNLCRLLYSFGTRDVVISKRGSAHWARIALPEWRPLIEAALRAYDRQSTQEDKDLLGSQIGAFLALACERIETARTYQE